MTTQLRFLVKEFLQEIPWQTKLQPTLPAHKVSRVLHEPAILDGYRVPYQPWRYYLFSLFQLHNETVNVWTHIIGVFVVLHQLYGYSFHLDFSQDRVAWTLLVFGITSIVGLATSATVHLIHAKSPYVHFVAFMADYIGATFCSFGTGIGTFYGVSDPSFYHAFDGIYLPFHTVVSVLNFVNLCLAKLWYGDDPHNMNRKYMFLCGMGTQAVVTMAPFLPRYYKCFQDETCSLHSLDQLTVITVIFFLQAITFASHQPEKTWPGKFDILGHGHQIFHVLVVLNDVLQMEALYRDHQLGLNGHGNPSLSLLLLIMAGMFLLDVLILAYLKRFVPASLKRVHDRNHED